MSNKTRRKLRMSLGLRTSRRHGVKKGEGERPRVRLERLVKEQQNVNG